MPTPTTDSPTLSPAVALITADMGEVDAVIRRRLASDVALINQIAHYIISAGGKR
ncbi:MAG TPA: octaprenyl diphosphate synthase, partial [Albitalea sp.]|nr:octaprenyl diphosphate synthase [Albitalea sp.]